jgi:hypothetical protein
VCLGGLGAAAAAISDPDQATASGGATVTVGRPAPAAPIAPGFLGLSFEYQSAAAYAGGSPDTVNPVFEQLIRNLTPNQAPVLRISGDSTDHTWWPRPGIARSPGLTYALTPTWIATIASLAHDLGARLLLGVNLEANNPKLAAAEARALIGGIGRGSVDALQIGNEPNLYSRFPWYTTARGRPVAGRAPGWDVARYLRQLARIRRALPAVPLAGPDLGDPTWMTSLGRLLRAEPRIAEVTFHRYAGNRCFGPRGTPSYASIANLLSQADSRGLAATVAPYAAQARAHHDAFRVDELNSEACGGKAGVSDTFASALWMLDTLFAMAQNGATGVNVQTYPSSFYRLFTFTHAGGQWSGSVAPEYYGLLMFAQAAPPGSRLLRIRSNAGVAIRTWATTGADRTIRVTLINDSTSSFRTVAVRLRTAAATATATATAVRLEAPSVEATGGVTIGGMSFPNRTPTGTLSGRPRLSTVARAGGSYRVGLPPGSATLLTIPRAR